MFIIISYNQRFKKKIININVLAITIFLIKLRYIGTWNILFK